MPNKEVPIRVKEGLRDRNKREKLERILAAARDAFGRDGYEATTLRQVAAAADVAVGTVFLYAPTKEDLLVLVFRRELEPLVENAFTNIPNVDLKKQLIHTFDTIIKHHSKNIKLSRPFSREMMFLAGDQRARVIEFMDRWRDRIAELFERAKLDGQLKPEADSKLLARCCIDLFIAGLREWVSGHNTQERFEAALPLRLNIVLTGFVIESDSTSTSKRNRVRLAEIKSHKRPRHRTH